MTDYFNQRVELRLSAPRRAFERYLEALLMGEITLKQAGEQSSAAELRNLRLAVQHVAVMAEDGIHKYLVS